MQGMLFHPIVLEIVCVFGEKGAVMVVLAPFHGDWCYLIACFHSFFAVPKIPLLSLSSLSITYNATRPWYEQWPLPT